MITLLEGKRYHVFITRQSTVWLEMRAVSDYHGIIVSATLLTFELGLEYIWKRARYTIKKKNYGFTINL